MKKTYLLTVVLLTLLISVTNSQIVYTDIQDGVPDGIDFDSDGVNEFDIDTFNPPDGDCLVYLGYGDDNNIHALNNVHDSPSCEDMGFSVDATNAWSGYGDCSVNNWGNGNPTITPGEDTYMCMRFNLGGTEIYYGWVRINVANSGVVTYKDYAYNSTPDNAINTGDLGSTTVVSVTSITVQGQGGVSTITSDDGTLQMEASVFPDSATNKTVTWTVNNGTGSATIDTDGLLTAINNGTVTVTATANDNSGVLGTTEITISNQVSVLEVLANSISIYPNPFSNYISINSKLVSEFQTMTIYSSDGKIVQNSTLYNSTAKYFNLSELDNGIYLLALTTKKGNIIFKKLIKIS